jgi:hypothetical protein
VSNTYCVEFLFVLFFLRFVYPVLPVSLDCPFLIAPSVFYNIYWHTTYLLYILIPSPFPSVLNNLWNFRSDDFKLSKSSFWLSWSHHFESFSVATLTWLTVAEYVCHGYVPLVVSTSRSFHHSWIITGFATRVTQIKSLVEQKLPTLPEHMSSSPVFSGVRVALSLVFGVVF